MLTLNQAKQHLLGISKLACVENRYLSCVHSYLRTVEVDVLEYVRGDQFTSHDQIADLIHHIGQVQKQVDSYLRGDL